MKSASGMPNTSSLAITAKAAKLRLFMTDNVASGGLRILSLSRMIEQAGAELAFRLVGGMAEQLYPLHLAGTSPSWRRPVLMASGSCWA